MSVVVVGLDISDLLCMYCFSDVSKIVEISAVSAPGCTSSLFADLHTVCSLTVFLICLKPVQRELHTLYFMSFYAQLFPCNVM